MKPLTIKIILLFIVCIYPVSTFAQKQLSVKEFEMAVQKNVQLLDVRTKAEYDQGHIKNAIQANWYDKIEFLQKTNSLNKSKPVYIYCQIGVRSSEASKFLTSKGFMVFELKGGFDQWKAELGISY